MLQVNSKISIIKSMKNVKLKMILLIVSGCTQLASVEFNHHLDASRRLLLQYLDLTDCFALDDNGLKTVVQNCPQLVYLYLRRCTQITGKH